MRARTGLVAALAALLATASVAAEPPLSALCIDGSAVSVSGISSGGFMAHQFHVAHSAGVMGAAVIAGGPYACAGDDYPQNLVRALNVCSAIAPGPFRGPPDVTASIAAARAAAKANTIDGLTGLQGDRVLLFSGRYDQMVPAAVVAAAGAFYRGLGNNDGVVFIDDVEAGHAMITDDFGNACRSDSSPWINDCDFDLAAAALAHIYGELAPRLAPAAELNAFAQAEFVDEAETHGLAERGFIYVPRACADGGCRLHVAFHGCRQNEALIGDAFVRHAGYNGWAEANDIVVLYPQTAVLTSTRLGVPVPWPNPRGCWDWWGFTGPHYADRRGPQIQAVAAMIDRLSEPTGGRACADSAAAPRWSSRKG